MVAADLAGVCVARLLKSRYRLRSGQVDRLEDGAPLNEWAVATTPINLCRSLAAACTAAGPQLHKHSCERASVHLGELIN